MNTTIYNILYAVYGYGFAVFVMETEVNFLMAFGVAFTGAILLKALTSYFSWHP